MLVKIDLDHHMLCALHLYLALFCRIFTSIVKYSIENQKLDILENWLNNKKFKAIWNAFNPNRGGTENGSRFKFIVGNDLKRFLKEKHSLFNALGVSKGSDLFKFWEVKNILYFSFTFHFFIILC